MNEKQETQRIDKWLHHVRAFKTRALATQACTKGNVRMQNQAIKPSRGVRAGDILDVERGVLVVTLRVKALPVQRQGASRVADFVEDLTPPERYEKAAAIRREEAMIRVHPHEALAKPNKQQMRQLRAWMEDQTD
jgi:ribosome-associated heat shock protein Hsp15